MSYNSKSARLLRSVTDGLAPVWAKRLGWIDQLTEEEKETKRGVKMTAISEAFQEAFSVIGLSTYHKIVQEKVNALANDYIETLEHTLNDCLTTNPDEFQETLDEFQETLDEVLNDFRRDVEDFSGNGLADEIVGYLDNELTLEQEFSYYLANQETIDNVSKLDKGWLADLTIAERISESVAWHRTWQMANKLHNLAIDFDTIVPIVVKERLT